MPRNLDAEIADAHARLAELDERRHPTARGLDRLPASDGVDRQTVSGDQLSAAAKLELFRDLFRGRQDVFAVRWENRAKGRNGYSPGCDHE